MLGDEWLMVLIFPKKVGNTKSEKPSKYQLLNIKIRLDETRQVMIKKRPSKLLNIAYIGILFGCIDRIKKWRQIRPTLTIEWWPTARWKQDSDGITWWLRKIFFRVFFIFFKKTKIRAITNKAKLSERPSPPNNENT